MRSWSELKSRVGHLTNWATQVPLYFSFWCETLFHEILGRLILGVFSKLLKPPSSFFYLVFKNLWLAICDDLVLYSSFIFFWSFFFLYLSHPAMSSQCGTVSEAALTSQFWGLQRLGCFVPFTSYQGYIELAHPPLRCESSSLISAADLKSTLTHSSDCLLVILGFACHMTCCFLLLPPTGVLVAPTCWGCWWFVPTCLYLDIRIDILLS